MTGNKIADRIKKASQTPPQNNSVTNNEEILREKHIPSEDRQKIVDDLRLI